ncbi:MAG: polyphenol oxidase [Candidatus Schmidhempelia sp.]|nr:polyphenol oxidase [Candidatus Schmidhempelia sp.]
MTLLYPNWRAPKNVHACSTLRQGGISIAPYNSFNLGMHVGDDAIAVAQNRDLLIRKAALPRSPIWLEQVHKTRVINLDYHLPTEPVQADGSYTTKSGQVCVVMTADCLPILFCSQAGDEVAVAHAGWRGLCHGIIENTVHHFHAAPQQIQVWLGPAIGPSYFEVGKEVKKQFEKRDPNAAQAFQLINNAQQKYLADIYLLAKQRLNTLGITQIFGGDRCTVSEPDSFFSYRRDHITGRMATMIWLE